MSQEMRLVLAMIFSCVVTVLFIFSGAEARAEYEIDLINQDSVKIYSVDGDKTYYTTPDSIQYYIEIDNL